MAGSGAETGAGTEAVEAIGEIAGVREEELETESTTEESGEPDKVPEEESPRVPGAVLSPGVAGLF